MGEFMKKKKKPRVEEINGVLWQLDDAGNKVKKVKRKTKDIDSPPKSPEKLKKKDKIKEVDGILYLVDAHGVPVKKVRRKGTNQELQRAKSHIAVNRGDDQVQNLSRDAPPVQRSQSVGSPLGRIPGEYVDNKGRRIVVEADGTKSVYDKDGKKLRPKKKDDAAIENGDDSRMRAKSAGLGGSSPLTKSPSRRANGQLPSSARFVASSSRPCHPPVSRNGQMTASQPVSRHEIKEKLSEIDRENIELKMKLMEAKDQADDLGKKVQKEKAKNVKASAEADHLRVKHEQVEENNRTLHLKIKNMEARLDEMDRRIENAKTSTGKNESSTTESHDVNDNDADHLVTQLAKLRLQNLSLLNKLDSQKGTSSADIKEKEKQISKLNEEVAKTRLENDRLFSGSADVDFVRTRLMQEKKELANEVERIKKETEKKVSKMKVTADSLQKANTDLRKQVEKATLEINDNDDDEIRLAKEMAQAVAQHGTRNAARAKRASIHVNNGSGGQQQQGSGFGLDKLSAIANASISGIAI